MKKASSSEAFFCEHRLFCRSVAEIHLSTPNHLLFSAINCFWLSPLCFCPPTNCFCFLLICFCSSLNCFLLSLNHFFRAIIWFYMR